MDNETVDEEYIVARSDAIEAISQEFWRIIVEQYENDGFSEDDMLEIFAAIGLFSGQLMDQAFYANSTLPYQLFGTLSDIAHRSLYCYRYGINLDELEQAKQTAH